MCFLNFLKSFCSKLLDNKQLWKYVRLIPLINTIFGSARVIRNLINCLAIRFSHSQVSSEDQESDPSSGAYPLKKRLRRHLVNAIKSGLYAVAAAAAVLNGIVAVLIPIYFGVSGLWSFLLCSVINNFIGGFGSFIVKIKNDEILQIANWNDIEDVLYERAIKATPLIAVGYCPIRALVYLKSYGDKRQAKASAKDLIINVVSIAVAYVVFQFIDISSIVALIDENLAATQSGFASFSLNYLRKLLSSQIFTLPAAQCINVGAQLVRNSSLLMEAGFPYVNPDLKQFNHCLERPYDFIKDDSDKAYMKSHVIKYVVKCVVGHADDTLSYKSIIDKKDDSVLKLAFEGGNPGVLQAVVALAPSLMIPRCERYARIIVEMLNKYKLCFQKDSDHYNIMSLRPEYLVDRFLEEIKLICCDTHQNVTNGFREEIKDLICSYSERSVNFKFLGGIEDPFYCEICRILEEIEDCICCDTKRSVIKKINRIDSDSKPCVNHILGSCIKPSESILNDSICCDAHTLDLEEPVFLGSEDYKKQYRGKRILTYDGESKLILGTREDHQRLYRGSRVLSIDGGGTRGVVSLEILKQLEETFREKDKSPFKIRLGYIRDHFDLIVGTSTGGLIALLLADGKRCEDIPKLYFELKDKVFCGRKGNASEFASILKDIFKDRLMNSIPVSKIKVVITTSVIHKNEFIRKDFTNFHEESSKVPIWMVARCTAAAPGFFPPFKDDELGDEPFYDGGLTANNPVSIIIDHLSVLEMLNSTIVSIGTGKYNDTMSSQKLIVSRSIPGFVRMVGDGTLLRFVNLVVNQVTRTEGDIVNNAKYLCQCGPAYFYRLNPTLTEKLELNETDDEKLVNAIWNTKVFTHKYCSIIKDIAKRLEEKMEDQITSENIYNDMFIEPERLGRGIDGTGYGKVYKVKDKFKDHYYAIKIYRIISWLDLRPFKMMFEFDKNFVVEHIDSWIEQRASRDDKHLYIQMEYYSHNLKTFLNEINNEMSEIFHYFICCELLIELIECVNYLHSFSPPIIHKNIKREKILISNGNNERFLKLCDIGLEKSHAHSTSLDSTVTKYMAPEVFSSRDYYPKSDIYSIALIATEIFRFKDTVEEIIKDKNHEKDINLSKYCDHYSDETIKTKFNSLLEILSDCLLVDYNKRPDSKRLMESINELTVDTNTLNDQNIDAFRQTLNNEILKQFFETKLRKISNN